MDDARGQAEELLERAESGLRRLLPSGLPLGDAHTHLGLDEDGMTLDLETLLGGMERFGIARALVFPLNEPDRHPGYRLPNDRVLAWAERSDGRLVPLARLDLAEDPVGEAKRCIERGARGIKLHPRAQRFAVDDGRLEPVFALAEEHRLPVLIHAGRGMPPIGEALARVSERHPGAILILAHAAIVDQHRICTRVAGMPNVFFDTSTWGVVDILSLLSMVAPQQVLYAADVPYGNFLSGLVLVAAVLEELDAAADVRRGVLGATLEAILRHELPALTAPIAPSSWTLSHARQRVSTYLAAATPLVWMRQPDAIGLADLALAACDGDESLRDVAGLIAAAASLWLGTGGGADAASDLRCVYRLVHLAQVACFAPRAMATVLA